MTQRGMADDLMREMLQAMDARDARLAARLGFTGNYLSASHVVGAGGSLLTHGATGHIAGNPGDILYAGASGQWNRRAGPTTVAEVKWLQISGGASANLASGPQWATLPSAAAGAPHAHDNSGTASGGPLLNDLHTGYSEYRLISTPTTATGIQLYGKTGTSGLFYQTPGGQEIGPLSSAAAGLGNHNHDVSGTASGGGLTNDLHLGYSQYRLISTPTTTTGIQLYGKTGTSGLFYQTPDGQEIGPLASGSTGAGAGSGVAGDDGWGARGDLFVGTTDNSATRLPVGTAYQFLHPSTAQTMGLEWQYRSLVSHLDASAGVTTGASNEVSAWEDQSGFGVDFRQAVTATAIQPAYTTNIINGHPVIRFDGADDYLKAKWPFDMLPAFTLMMVIRPQDAGSEKGILQVANALGSVSPQLLVQRNTTTIRFYFNAGYRYTHNHGASGITKLYTFQWDGFQTELFINGSTTGKQTLTIDADDNYIFLGYGYNGYSAVDIGELRLYSKVLRGTQRTAIESALKTKYGLST